jgi:D-glycero-D-manno-heptose 1,7-bisphosphate phosphatase
VLSPIVFLDRDGVLNACLVDTEGTPIPPRSMGELELLGGVEEACALLSRHGYRLVVVTNQPDVARGKQERAVVEEINQWLASRLPLDDVHVCWHDDADGCECRKPRPGLLLAAAQDAGVDLADCVMVGDRWRDIEAGRRAGCRTALVGTGYGEQFPSAPDFAAESLVEVARWITSSGLMEEVAT